MRIHKKDIPCVDTINPEHNSTHACHICPKSHLVVHD